MNMYTVTSVDVGESQWNDGLFATHLFTTEDGAREHVNGITGIQPDQVIIGETLVEADGVWYDSIEKAEEDGGDFARMVRVDMHILPGGT